MCTLRHDVLLSYSEKFGRVKSLIEMGELSPLIEVERIFSIIFGQSSSPWLRANVLKSISRQAPLQEDIHTALKHLTLRNGTPNTEMSPYPFFLNFYGGLCRFQRDVSHNFRCHCLYSKERPTLHSQLHCLEVVKARVHLGAPYYFIIFLQKCDDDPHSLIKRVHDHLKLKPQILDLVS